MAGVPHWRLVGDWFDVCKCTIPCPCTFAQAPSEGDCEGILAWHIREGSYGSADAPHRLAFLGSNSVVVADARSDHALRVYNVSDPADPFLVGYYDTPGIATR